MRRILWEMRAESLQESIYVALPIVFQNAACWYYGKRQARIRFGSRFHSTLAFLLESDSWSRREIAAHQDDELRKLVTHSYQTVPFYRERMRNAGVTPAEIETVADLDRLPILTREDVRHNILRMISSEANRRNLVFRHTSGTTGKRLHFYRSRAAIAFQWAVWWRHRMRFGLGWGDWHAHFTPRRVVPPKQDRPPYWRWLRPLSEVVLNVQHLTPRKIRDIVDFLNRQHLEFYSGYPSIIHVLARMATEENLELTSRPKVVLTGAETLLRRQRHDIEQFTGAPVTDHYGMSEGCGNASQCREGLYHEDSEFAILECVDPVELEDGKVRGRIICTGLAERDVPFIRYDTGDVGIWSAAGETCSCGRASRTLVAIEGRGQDCVITPEGRRIMRFDPVFFDTTNVNDSQVVQRSQDEITVRIVRRPSYAAKDEDLISERISCLISPSLKVRFDYVPEIERERDGKFRAVKSCLEE